MGFNQGLAKAAIPRVPPAWLIKRILDVVMAAAGLLLLSPLMVLVGIAIKLETGGPVFRREVVFGYANQTIRALKFQTSTSSAKASGIRAHATRVGRVLRHTGIDELPQLVNVLLGELSIVGPRAYVRRQELPVGPIRPLLVAFKPGLTGWVQFLEARYGHMTAGRRIAEDLRYAKQWSLLLDLKILLMTLFLPARAHTAA